MEFDVVTRDVIHSFWVPEFRLKTDTVPGLDTHIRRHARPARQLRRGLRGALRPRPLDHARARARGAQAAVRRLAGESREGHLHGTAPAGGGASTTSAAGKALFTANGCNSCHTLADANATGTVGPNLNNLVANVNKYGKQLGENPEQYVTQSIKDPGAFTVPGFPKGVCRRPSASR